jgi:hypothetical protein
MRRSAASHMTSIGISRFIVGRILNHSERGVTAVYDRHSYDREKREALDTWAKRLEKIVERKSLEASAVPGTGEHAPRNEWGFRAKETIQPK